MNARASTAPWASMGIPGFEDKVAQRAVLMRLEPIYEQDFVEGSCGFRPGRNAHQALQAVRRGLTNHGMRRVLDADIRQYFVSIPHGKLRELLARRVTDGVVRRLIDKWLSAGVLEDGGAALRGQKHAGRRRDLAALGQHLPALRAGRMA